MGIDSVKGGPILGVKVVAAGELEENGGVYVIADRYATPVHGFTAATNERAIIGGTAEPVYIVSQAEIDSGRFVVKQEAARPVGDLAVLGVTRTVRGRVARPVYLAGGSLS